MFRKLASAILCAGILGASQSHALGLGELTLHSALNEPLDAEIKLLSVGDLTEGQVIVNLGTQGDFEQAGVDRDYFLTNLKFKVELDGNGNGVVHIRTHNLVNEPYLNFIIEARWPAGKLLREYTALLDLPIYSERATAQVNLGSESGKGSTAISRAAPASEPLAHPAAASGGGYTGGENYETQRADTLWKIAQQMKPAGDVSLQKTMVAIHDLNPDAFINGDINLLRQGAVLRLPSADQIRQVSSDSARSALAGKGSSRRQHVEAGVDTADTLPVERESTPAADARLTLSSSGTGTAEGSGSGEESSALKGKLNESLENLDRSERDNADLKSRVSQMQAQVDKLQRLVQLKDEQLAALQQQSGAKAAQEKAVAEQPVTATAESAPTPAPTEPAAAVQPETTAVAQPEKTPAAQPEATAATPATSSDGVAQAPAATEQTEPVPVAEAVPQQAKPVAKPIPKPQTVTPPAPKQGLLEMVLANPLYLDAGAGVLVLLLVGGFLLRQRAVKRAADEAALTAGDNFDTDAFDQTFDEEPADHYEEAFDEESVEQVVDEVAEQAPAPSSTRSETGDAIGEADIYVAYGRYQHAIDLLKNAVASEPARSDLRVKLLEVYLEAGDREGFRSQFAALQSLGDADATGRAKEMLMSVDDGSAWIGEGASSSFDGDVTLPTSFAPSDAGDLDVDNTMERPAITDEDLADLDLGDELEETDTAWANTEELDELPASLGDAEDAGSLDELDLDLGLDEESDTLNSAESLSLDQGMVLESDEDALMSDDELGLDIDELDEAEFVSDAAGDVITSVSDSLDDELDLTADSDFELATGAVLDSESSASSGEIDLADDALELDAELDAETIETGFSKNLQDIDAEIGAFDAESLQAASDLNLGDDEEFDFLSDSDEVSTKLDLARAYIDMGDVDGARDILQEVLQEGEVAQKEEANKLLARIA